MRVSVLASVLCFVLVSVGNADPASAAIRKSTNIPAEPLDLALKSLAKERQFQVLFRAEVVRDVRTGGAVGDFTPEEAIKQLLSGTGLSYTYLDANTVTVFAAAAPAGVAAGAGQYQTNTSQDNSKEAGKKSSQDFHVAQVDQGQTSSPSTVEKQEEQTPKKKAVSLEEVIVTGSRIPTATGQTAQDVKIYTSEQIEQSGQTTIADFFNTLPDVAQATGDSNLQVGLGATSVSLHGLPVGTTLILINGRRIETSGAQTIPSFFDLNNIPLGAVDRIEVMSEGSSAIYGSDAIGGVINILLKEHLDGLEANVKYGHAADMSDTNANLSWGHTWDDAAISVIGAYQNRGELLGFDRSITGDNDYRRFGAADTRYNACNPGNVFSLTGSNLPGLSAPFAAVPPGFTAQPTQGEFAGTAGTLNSCSLGGYTSYIPATQRYSLAANGEYTTSRSLEFFTELLASHVEQDNAAVPPLLYGAPGFQSFTVSASNPNNPFGQDVGVAGLLSSAGPEETPTATTFVRALLGAKGDFAAAWHWELAVWHTQDWENYSQTNYENATALQNALNSSNPATALNPFVDGPYGSAALLSTFLYTYREEFGSATEAANGFVRGPIATLPAGPVETVLGAEFDHDRLTSDLINNPFQPPNTRSKYERNWYAFFTEMRVPILGTPSEPAAAGSLNATLAGRYDHYADFGGKFTPQFGLQWRPLRELMMRGTYAKAFKAPNLTELHTPQVTFPMSVADPANGNQQELAAITEGGNPNLQAETGTSRTVGIVYSSERLGGLRVSLTGWRIDETNSIQFLDPQTIVNNENLFPGDVTRNAAGLIAAVFAGPVNYGTLEVSGIDFQISCAFRTGLGVFRPSISATDTTHYTASLLPGAPATSRLSVASDGGLWAPRWKGMAGAAWSLGPVAVSVAGRYVGSYQDYDTSRELGNFWFADTNLRYAVGQSFSPSVSMWRSTYIELGAVNLFNRLPQYSNFFGGGVGYDPAEADLRGRFLYLQVGVKL